MPDAKKPDLPFAKRLENYLRVSAPGESISGRKAGTWLVEALTLFRAHTSVLEIILEDDRLQALVDSLHRGNETELSKDTRLTKALFVLMKDTSFLFIASGDEPKPVMLLSASSLDRLKESGLEKFFFVAFGIRDNKDAKRLMRKWQREEQIAKYEQKLRDTQ